MNTHYLLSIYWDPDGYLYVRTRRWPISGKTTNLVYISCTDIYQHSWDTLSIIPKR